MASATRRDGKKGVSYQLCATVGIRPNGTPIRKYKTWHPPKGTRHDRMDAEALLAAKEFEKTFQMGFNFDDNQTFAEYAEYVLSEKERTGVKPRTLERYRELLPRINAAIGHLELRAILPKHLNLFYKNLAEPGIRCTQEKASAKMDIARWLKKNGMSRAKLAEKAGISAVTVGVAIKGETIRRDSAIAIAAAMDMKPEKVFRFEKDMTPLSNKTILEHHRLISTILEKAVKEMLVPYNAATKADPPKVAFTEPGILEPEEVADMLDALESEPMKWRVFTELLLATSGRRGEAAAIKWEKIDFETRLVRIDCQLIYTRKNGVVEAPTKTNECRILKLPVDTIALLKEHKKEQDQLRINNGDRWIETGYVLTQDNGEPINPQSITAWLAAFSKRHGLPHIHPHMLRHTGASHYIESGVDIATVSSQLGHLNPRTTQIRYVHAVKEARAKAEACIADLMYGRSRKRKESRADTTVDP